ncbi:tRNA (adenosine(37)-N6)-threonylcarbamoyltransferase complex ATPase subunit type 1 TsaE [Pseudanabaena sp. FACHB-2040]|uniref:tRNA (adenosine(37)-N6)-threonylcarbamoyltransferase complex ATPase subunit type 1 TsaE n=1 Tax=Pseudanabaena sp. FACHB-2040 TaxID=2692859 RepID=UPI001689F63C|nr:tRNA (adenosine(37)-N6)-threonylcarbamoyltransferase complex ATPase subunit type 1 TsaE [Pseudanabaena sp. FACHB-2040]MBD2256972.1 tRNA (adenosine(37)-N6)-threonylcarbamoyltransferase complex ATPase subunit type 1 TsaE [Pseudanabaena sp. FACHB-2040]
MAFVPTVLQLPNEPATRALGQQLGRHLPAGTVLLLRGDLGSGKTTLVKGLGEGLGLEETIDSPTFTLVNEYLDGRVPLYHVDLYRLETSQEVNELLLETYWEGTETEPGIMAIEWADRLPYQPDLPLTVALAYNAEGREATLTPTTAAQANVLETISQNAILAHEI